MRPASGDVGALGPACVITGGGAHIAMSKYSLAR
jgi:hypothetical protein